MIIEDLPHEIWREIQDYPGYFISNCGRIKSTKQGKPHLLTAFVNNYGYPRVALCKDGQSKHFLVSRLVAAAFCENPDPAEARTVDHIDGNKENNCAWNLQWTTMSDNIKNYYERLKQK